MKIYTAKKKMTMFLVNHILCGTRYFEMKRRLLNQVGYDIGTGTKIVGPIYNDGILKIGKNCWIGKNFTVNGNGAVQIGDNCDIAPDVMFLTGGHALGNILRRAGQGETYTIEIGNGVWLGARVTIGRTLKIGSGCVVAACACVMQTVPSNTMVGGVPAKMIKEFDHVPSQNATK